MRIDEVCERFEAAWQAGQSPRIEDFLGDVEAAERDALLRELLRVELDYRHRQGSAPTVEEYLERFPGHDSLIRANAARPILILVAASLLGMAAGVSAGANGAGVHGQGWIIPFLYLLGAGALAGGISTFVGWQAPWWAIRLRAVCGVTLGVGVAALAGATYWWLGPGRAFPSALVGWGGLLGLAWGWARGRPLIAAGVGGLVMGLVAFLGQTLANPDAAALLGTATGMAGGTLLWGGRRALLPWLARIGAAGLVVAVPVTLYLLSDDSGPPVRVFMLRSGGSDKSSEMSPPLSPAFSPEGDRLLVLDGDIVRLWDVKSGRELASFPPPKSVKGVGVTFSSEGEPLCFTLGGDQGKQVVEKWNVESGKRLASYPISGATRAVLSADGRMILAADDGLRALWCLNLTTGETISGPRSGDPGLGVMVVSPDGSCAMFPPPNLAHGILLMVLTVTEEGKPHAHPTQVSVANHGDPELKSRCVGFSADGSRGFSVTGVRASASLAVWDMSKAPHPQVLHRGNGMVVTRLTPEQRSRGKTWSRVLHAGKGKEAPTCAALSPDGRRLLEGTAGGSIYLWDVETGKKLRTYYRHRSFLLGWWSPVRQVAFTPDGKYALSCAANGGGMQLWKLAD
jgi:WD40 repeat protein